MPAARVRAMEAVVAGFHLAVVPIGKLSVADLEGALQRVSKALHQPVELREPLPVPRASEDTDRGQHRAAMMIQLLADEVRKLRPGSMVGGDEAAKAPLKPDGFVFVTDVDLFTAKTDGVFAAFNLDLKAAVVSIRRLREAHYKRRADPNRQRARVTKELLRMSGRLAGVAECGDPECVLSASKHLADLDAKAERFCRVCEAALFAGTIHI